VKNGATVKHFLFIFYYLIHPKGKGGTKRLGLHKGASQKNKNMQLHSQMVAWTTKQNKKNIQNILQKYTENNKYTHIHTPLHI